MDETFVKNSVMDAKVDPKVMRWIYPFDKSTRLEHSTRPQNNHTTNARTHVVAL